MAILWESGSRELTMRNLAKRISLSEAAIYRHFQDKEEIIQNLVNQTCDPSLLHISTEDKNNPLEILENLMSQQLANLSQKPFLTTIVFQDELFREYHSIKEKLQNHRLAKEKIIISQIEKGQKQRIFDNAIKPEVFALLFQGSIRMAVLKWKEAEFSYSLVQQGEQIMQELKRYLKGDK